MQDIVFGPILSRRFGVSLGVDLSPSKKQCNFDCLYCEIGKAKTVEMMDEVIPLDRVLCEIEKGLQKHQEIEVLSITASGEPTLYPYFLELSCKIKEMTKNRCKSLVLSNGSKFGDPIVQNALLNFDIVKFSLDCVSEQCFKKLDRPFRKIEVETILQGIAAFSSIFDGELVGEVLVIKNLNDSFEEMQKIADFMRELQIARIDLGSLDRPPAYAIQGVDFEVLENLSYAFKGMCVSIPIRSQKKVCYTLQSEQELIQILNRRPIAKDEFLNLFDKAGIRFLQDLIVQDRICIKKVANMEFFSLKS